MGTATGKTLQRRLVFENNIEAFLGCFKTAEQIKAQNGLSKIVYGLEPTGNYHKPLARHIFAVKVMLFWYPGKRSKATARFWMAVGIKMTPKMRPMWRIWYQGKMHLLMTPRHLELQNSGHLLSLRRRLKKNEHSLRMRIRNTTFGTIFS